MSGWMVDVLETMQTVLSFKINFAYPLVVFSYSNLIQDVISTSIETVLAKIKKFLSNPAVTAS